MDLLIIFILNNIVMYRKILEIVIWLIVYECYGKVNRYNININLVFEFFMDIREVFKVYFILLYELEFMRIFEIYLVILIVKYNKLIMLFLY